MKKILLFVFILTANWASAQIFVNQKNVNATNYQYIEVWEKFNRGTDQFGVMVDYGQDSQSENGNAKLKLHDKKGTKLEFNSIVSILNYFHLNGWELAEMKRTDEVESYLMKRRENFSLPKMEDKTSSSLGSN